MPNGGVVFGLAFSHSVSSIIFLDCKMLHILPAKWNCHQPLKNQNISPFCKSYCTHELESKRVEQVPLQYQLTLNVLRLKSLLSFIVRPFNPNRCKRIRAHHSVPVYYSASQQGWLLGSVLLHS